MLGGGGDYQSGPLEGTRSNYAKLEYAFEECYKALSEKLDWENPKRFKEGDFPRLWINDIEDMLILVVQNRPPSTNPFRRLYCCYFFSIALRMLTRSLIIQKRVEDLQLRVESNQKKINVTKPDTKRPDLRKRHPYTPYKDPQGFIYVDDNKASNLSSLEDITKNIDLEYLPKRRCSTLEKKRAHFMIKDINKLLKERRMMRSLKKFVDVLERFYTSAGNPVNEILLKLNLPNHRSILTDSKVTLTKHRQMTKPYSSPRFIANCVNAKYLKMEVKVPDSS
ncbi:hypothetical protein Tco_1431036 [Tanacetum coccineum]